MVRPVNHQRRTEVLDQVIAYLSTNGIAELSIRKLADALGVSTSVITHQFGTKEALILDALTRAREANLVRFQEMRAQSPGLGVADAFLQIWTWWAENPSRIAFSRFNIEVMLSGAATDQGKRADLTLFWLDYFAEWLRQDGFSDADAQVKATLAISMLSGATVDLVSTGELDRLTVAMRAFAETLRPPA